MGRAGREGVRMALGLGWKLHGDGKPLGPGRRRRPRRALSLGQDRRARRPARRGDVRRHVRLPADHGAQPPARDHDERHRDDRFLLIVQGKVPSYLGTSASFVGGVAAIRAQGGDSAEVTGAILVAGLVLAARRRADPLPRLGRAAQGAAAGRHRRRRHADRLQPGAGRGQHLLAAGPVGRACSSMVVHRSSCAVGASAASSAASRSSSA